MILKELTIKNFLSHEDTKLIFKDNEKILLDGKSGSGKSSITEAILWTFYGRGRSDNRSLIRRGAKIASTSLKLTDGKQETLITRSVSSTGKNALAITKNTGTNGQFLPIDRVGIKDLQDWIENVFLHASFELFTNSISYPQDNDNSFVKANASRRKDLLLEIVRAGSFDELYEKTRKTISINELENASSVVKVETLENTIKTSEEIASKYEFYKKEVENVSNKLDILSLGEKELEKKLNDISSLSREIKSKEVTRDMIVKTITDIDKRLEEDSKIVEEHNAFDIETAKKNVQIADALILEIENIEKELRLHSEAQQKINAHLSNKPSVFDYSKDIELLNTRLIPLIKDTGKCPAGDACPFIIPIKGQIEFLEKQIEEKAAKVISEQNALDKWSKQYASLVPVKDTTELYNKLKDTRDRVNQLLTFKEQVNKWNSFSETYVIIQDRYQELDTKKKQYNVDLIKLEIDINELNIELRKLDINNINLDLSNLRITKQNLQKAKDEAVLGMNMATNAQLAIKTATIGLKELKRGILKATEDKEALELLKEALSPRGIKAVVVDWLIPQLEDKINNILNQLSDFKIRLDTQQSKVNEDDGFKEGLFITVINGQGEEMSYENFSGGEKVKVTIAISEALASLLSNIGFRLMDENIISLDKESTESFVEVLTKLQDKFPQLILISHLQEVKDIFLKKIMITKINGISQIK